MIRLLLVSVLIMFGQFSWSANAREPPESVIATPEPTQPSDMPVEVVDSPDLGLASEWLHLHHWRLSLRLGVESEPMAHIVAWGYTMPRIAAGAYLQLPAAPPNGPLDVHLVWPEGPVRWTSPVRIPQCLPEIAGWSPIYFPESAIIMHVGIWQRRVGGQTHRAIIAFDGRCDRADVNGSRYSIIASGPTLWRFVEVQPGYHSDPSIVMASEAGRGEVLTLARVELSRELFRSVYPDN